MIERHVMTAGNSVSSRREFFASAGGGFAGLALAWLYTGLRAYLAIRGGEIGEHRKWMVRNFSLTFAAVMLRLYLPLSMLAGVEFIVAYAIIAWLCWIPNLVYAEWKFNRVVTL